MLIGLVHTTLCKPGVYKKGREKLVPYISIGCNTLALGQNGFESVQFIWTLWILVNHFFQTETYGVHTIEQTKYFDHIFLRMRVYTFYQLKIELSYFILWLNHNWSSPPTPLIISQKTYHNRQERRCDLVMCRSILVCVQHEECRHSTWEADT